MQMIQFSKNLGCDTDSLEVRFFQRKPRPEANFSIEAIFEDVRRSLSQSISALVITSSWLNNGYFSKVLNAVEAWWRQGECVNHITGEVHFLNLLMRRDTVVLTVHDCGFMKRKRGISGQLVKLLYLDWPVRRSAIVTAVSEQTKSEIIKYTGCNPDSIRVIPNAIDQSFQPHQKDFNQELPTILQIGTGYNKNLQRLAESLAGIPCRLVVVGELSNSQLNAFKENEIRIENHVNLSQREMVKRYDECDIVSFVSTIEGFGLPIIEANTVERVVVTSNLSSMPEVAGDAACLVDPLNVESIRDGFKRVISDASYRKELIENGRLNRMRFDRNRVAEAYLELYREIAKNK